MATIKNILSQTQFDIRYITSSEIIRDLGISRAGFLYGRRRGKLPEPIVASDGHLMMWERTPDIVLKIADWKEAINSRKAA